MKAAYLPPLLLLLLLMVMAYLLHTASWSCFRNPKPVSTPPRVRNQLMKVVEATSMEDNTVILTLLNHQNPDAASILNLFLESFRLGIGTERFLNHLIILSTESRAFHYCKSVHPHCYNLAASGRKKLLQGSEWRRNRVMEQVLDLGYSIFYTDTDVLWFRNPLPHLDAYDVIAVAHKCINSTSEHRTQLPDGGLFYLKSEKMAIEFLKFWNFVRVLYPNFDAHSTLETLQDWSEPVKGVKFLDPVFFSSFCERGIDMSRACTVHANCAAERECKSHDLELLLNQWRNFRESSARKED